MSIIWKYLDKVSATIAAIKDFSSMEFIIKHTDEEIIAKRAMAEGVGSPIFDGLPHQHNPQAGEERIIKMIEEIDILKERYRQAVEYMDWFLPAWKELSEEERDVLETFYCNDEQEGAVYVICERYHIERSSAYTKKRRALAHLQVLLFGKT